MSESTDRTNPDAAAIMRKAEIRLKERVMKAHKDETILKGGTIAALGYKASIALARDCYEMGLKDALSAIEEVWK